MYSLDAVKAVLKKTADHKRAELLRSFFKTGKGQYGEGDNFLGIYVPVLRGHAKNFRELGRPFVEQMLRSPYNEERLMGLMILHQQFLKGDMAERQEIMAILFRNLGAINNWNLVDFAAPNLFGPYLSAHNKDQLSTWARSKDLWERRLAIVSTHHFIKNDDFSWTLKIAEQLMTDQQDLIHKAVGWMLREVGKRDEKVLERFLDQWTTRMPRTMLRYAIERFGSDKKRHYMTLKD
jgi:3-methyladenine DNA glycosylase AlkD